MEVILTDDVAGVGDIGERVTVRPGFARNYLIPRGLAVEAGAKDARILKHKMTQIEAKKRRLKGAAEGEAQKVRDLAVEFELRVGQSGKVFGSVGAKDIAEKLGQALGHAIDRRRVLISEPIKKVGTHFVKVRLHAEVETQLKVVVNQIEASKEQEEEEVKRVKTSIEEKTADTDDTEE